MIEVVGHYHKGGEKMKSIKNWFLCHIGAFIPIGICALIIITVGLPIFLEKRENKLLDERFYTDASPGPIGFVEVYSDNFTNLSVYREKMTDYVYIGYSFRSYGRYSAIDFTPMYDPETGKPLSYERFNFLYKNAFEGVTYNDFIESQENDPTTQAEQ
ncbi:hypothetical protein IJG79_03225 [Candidatus Saccharibacteria bacterium]|nr:hypothetical protein [Candidatus Saccharibacteria bacterium]